MISIIQIQQTLDWNKIRGNTPDTLNLALEADMLREEVQEFVDATSTVDQFDALLDLTFVLVGTLGKLGISAQQISDGYDAVLEANNKKSTTKNAAGKITKPADFVGPEAKLKTILNIPEE